MTNTLSEAPPPPPGYRAAGVMTIGFDGGNFDVKSPVFEHEACGCLVLPSGVGSHKEFHAEGGRRQDDPSG
jgi:hypothetical protein